MEARINCINFVLKSKTCSRGGHTESGNQEIITYWSWVGAENKTNSSAHFHPILMLCELPFLFGLIHTKSPITEQNRFFVDREKENDEKTTGRKIYPPQVWTAHTKLQKIFFISVCEILWNVCAWVLARARHHQEWKIARTKSQWKCERLQWPIREMPIECNRETRAEFYWLFVARELLNKHDHLAVGMWKRKRDPMREIISSAGGHFGMHSIAANRWLLLRFNWKLYRCQSAALVLSAFHKSNDRANREHKKAKEKNTKNK